MAQFLKLSHQLARMWRSLVGPVSDDKNRAEQGNFGDHKFCRDGVWELRVDVGAGYRVYYGIAKGQIVLLLCGGDKRTQSADIDRACAYWQDWQRRAN